MPLMALLRPQYDAKTFLRNGHVLEKTAQILGEKVSRHF